MSNFIVETGPKMPQSPDKVIANTPVYLQGTYLDRCSDKPAATCIQKHKFPYIVSCSKTNLEENSSERFGKPTSHYHNHPDGFHSIIS